MYGQCDQRDAGMPGRAGVLYCIELVYRIFTAEFLSIGQSELSENFY